MYLKTVRNSAELSGLEEGGALAGQIQHMAAQKVKFSRGC
jgi:hypothetical protein